MDQNIEIRTTIEYPRVEYSLADCVVPQIYSAGSSLDGTLLDLCIRLSRSSLRIFVRESRNYRRGGKH